MGIVKERRGEKGSRRGEEVQGRMKESMRKKGRINLKSGLEADIDERKG